MGSRTRCISWDQVRLQQTNREGISLSRVKAVWIQVTQGWYDSSGSQGIQDPHLSDPPPQNVASIFKVTSQSKMTAGTPAIIFIFQATEKVHRVPLRPKSASFCQYLTRKNSCLAAREARKHLLVKAQRVWLKINFPLRETIRTSIYKATSSISHRELQTDY